MRKYLAVIEKTKTGFSSYVPDLPGCIATGKTRKQAEKNIYAAIEFHLEGMKQHRLAIPEGEAEAVNVLVEV